MKIACVTSPLEILLAIFSSPTSHPLLPLFSRLPPATYTLLGRLRSTSLRQTASPGVFLHSEDMIC